MCGVVDGGVSAGAFGYEAGQSAVGDIFAWWTGLTGRTHEELSAKCAAQPVGAHGLVALDWMGGNRSVLVDHALSGVIVGLTLASRPEDVYRALLEATAYGTRVIVEALEAADVPVTEFVVAGGLKRNALLMQIYADVLRRPVSVATSDQAPALGSAIHAAVAAGAYPDIVVASNAMGRVERHAYFPDVARADAYDELFAEYWTLHDYFSARGAEANAVLHRLRARRNEASPAAWPTTI